MDHDIFTGKVFTGATVAAVALTSWLGVSPLSDPGEAAQEKDELRVCADPNNMPFSNRAEEGFHNELAQLFAEELGMSSVSYTWWRQHRGFIRNTLREHKCDVVFGVPDGYDILQPTKPFYRSPYVFLYRSDAGFDVSSLDDPVLRKLKIGVPLIGDDYANPPPAHALGARGIVGNVKGYTVYGDYSKESPPRRIVDAVANGDVELAMVWGPVAGYWAHQHEGVSFEIEPMPAVDDSTGFPLAYSMSLGVRKGEDEWQARLEKVIDENQEKIYDILEKYHVPLLPLEGGEGGGESGEAEGSATGAAETARSATSPAPVARLASRPGPADHADAPSGEDAVEVGASARRPLASVLREAERGAARDTPVGPTVYNGWKWFMVYCTRCHGETGTGSTIAPSLLEAVNRQTFVEDSFVHVVMEGRPEKGMPAWNELLDSDQAHAIYEYIHARTQGLAAGRPERAQPDSAAAGGGG